MVSLLNHEDLPSTLRVSRAACSPTCPSIRSTLHNQFRALIRAAAAASDCTRLLGRFYTRTTCSIMLEGLAEAIGPCFIFPVRKTGSASAPTLLAVFYQVRNAVRQTTGIRRQKQTRKLFLYRHPWNRQHKVRPDLLGLPR
jgi:hypothetical protein